MLGIGRGESYVIKQSGLRIQRDHTLHIESVLLANAVKGRVLIFTALGVQRWLVLGSLTTCLLDFCLWIVSIDDSEGLESTISL
jgi:hypothetical protein